MISLTQARFITIGENIFFDILIYIKLTKNYAVLFFSFANTLFHNNIYYIHPEENVENTLINFQLYSYKLLTYYTNINIKYIFSNNCNNALHLYLFCKLINNQMQNISVKMKPYMIK